MSAKVKSSTCVELTTDDPFGDVEVAAKRGLKDTRMPRRTSSSVSSGSPKPHLFELSTWQVGSETSSVGFNQDAFDAWYPDEDRLIEARKRLISSAETARESNLNIQAWWKVAAADSELSYYVKLLGDDVLLHIGMFVWFPLR